MSQSSSLPPTLNFSKVEEEIYEKWKKEDTFRTQDRLSVERGDKEYTFYDGPPFATGLPHYGHILAGTIKDVVTRYAAQTSRRVSRRAGWDCHGLPVEYEIDQSLGITHRDQVLEMGIDKYNETCRGIVLRYTKEWEYTLERLGRWIDFENDYKTMDVGFMESVWWVFSRLFEKNLVYRGYKVMPFSTACGTPLSNFEAGLNYKQVKDPAIVVTFPLEGEEGTSFLAWTTTPWTLPSNIALCVHPTMEYVKILDKKSGTKYILAKSRLCQLYPVMNSKKWKPEKAKDLYEEVQTYAGQDLAGLKYKPLFPYFPCSTYYQVLIDTYVTDDSGTGVVHQAPAFGEDDYRVCLAHNVIQKGNDIPCPVDSNGNFTHQIPEVSGKHVKDADGIILQILKQNNRLVQKEVLEHSYPFCWRSDTPLIYKAVPSWFIKVEEIKDNLVANNEKTYWVPANVGEGRFQRWLLEARDWAVSRNRFWGTPIPIWTNDDFSEVVCIGSIDELKRKASIEGEVTDLHRESVDGITIPSATQPGTVLRRIDEVFDCWFESGSMPYAQKHYPFENKQEFESTFPADFIAEGLDQTRGWFYTLMVLSTALFDKPAFQNLIVNGLVLASDGKKMSKRLKNYPDPMLIVTKYGADALRMYLINSPVVRAEPLKFQESGVLSVVKEVFLPWYNAFRFFMQNVHRWQNNTQKSFIPSQVHSTNPTDVWILAATQNLISFVHTEMKAYRLYTVMPALVSFVTQLSNWYIRLNRDRLKGDDDEDKDPYVSLQVLYKVLLDVTSLMSPFTPFFTEYLYQHLRKFQPSYQDRKERDTLPVLPGKSNSVHYLPLPTPDETQKKDDAILQSMTILQSIVECGRVARERRNISLRTPVKSVVVVLRSAENEILNALKGPLQKYILTELNAWELRVIGKSEEEEWIKLSLTPNFTLLGKKLGKKMKDVKKLVEGMSHSEAIQAIESGKIVVDAETTISTDTEIISKLSFAKTEPHWESVSTPDGDLCMALDCTQDEAVLSSGKCREFINIVQQLRKNSGLDVTDIVEVFYHASNDDVTDALKRNLNMLHSKLKGIVPLPLRHRPDHSVVLGRESGEVGNTKVEVVICRRALSVKDDCSMEVTSFLATLDPKVVEEDNQNGNALHCTIDGTAHELKHGVDYWLTAVDKAKCLKAYDWLV